ncbi:MAG: TonB family protein [Candidatus Methylopumilus sp.]
MNQSTDLSMPFALAQMFGYPAEKDMVVSESAALAVGRSSYSAANKHSNVALVLVMVAHGLVFWALLNAPETKPLLEKVPMPMTVSLINAPTPEPEVVPVIPTPPKPQPVVKKQKQKPREVTPTPQLIEAAPAQVVETSVPTPPTPSPVVAKAPEVKPEPEKPQVKEDVIEEPKFGVAYLNNPAPNYPALSRRLGEQGRVLMRVLVSVNGDAETVTVESSSGSSRLDQAAMEAVKKWQFIPAKKNKQPISAYVLVPVKFSLDNA